jgi:protein TonB
MTRLTRVWPSRPSRSTLRDAAVRNEKLTVAFLISLAVHLSAILISTVVVHKSTAPPEELLPVKLIEIPRRESSPAPKTVEAPRQIAKPPPPRPPVKPEKPKEPAPMAKSAIVRSKPLTPPVPALALEEPAQTAEPQPPPDPAKFEPPAIASGSPAEGGGSPAGGGSLFNNGSVGVMPGPGSAGGGGSAASGLGRGAGAPGRPAQSVLSTQREAKPLETVRANYPPMALRAGLESDVTLKIEVDARGNVTRAEITKSGGSGFDEEALQAVKRSRFQPAQRDGQNIPAEFTYVYRFRLQK